MNVLELFAGSRSIGIEAEKLGCNVFSVDWHEYQDIDLAKDIELITSSDIPFIPDMIWASPDCTTYTIAAISHHRNGVEPESEYAKKCDNVNRHFINMIEDYIKHYPHILFFIENPRGMMRKMPFIKHLERRTVWYCKYGDDRAKPTDIWSNCIRSLYNPYGWEPRPMCYNGNKKCHHQAAPRGSKTGTQGKSGSYDRSKIPSELCSEILKFALLYTGTGIVSDP